MQGPSGQNQGRSHDQNLGRFQGQSQNQAQGQSQNQAQGQGQGQVQSQDQGQARRLVRFAWALCRVEARSLGKDAFVAKYGSTHPGRACVEAQLPAVQAAADTCRAAVAGNGGFRACMRTTLLLPDRSGGGTQQSGSPQDPVGAAAPQ
jgi:hypothetical protein